MKKELIITSDGSPTFLIPEWKETYHSKKGSIEEAYHVFIKQGYNLFSTNCTILEVGFGTGLNTFITYLESKCNKKFCYYETIDAYPLCKEEYKSIIPMYLEILKLTNEKSSFLKFHNLPWGVEHTIEGFFKFKKVRQRIEMFKYDKAFDLIYYDAFCERVQPELWTKDIFEKMYKSLKPKGYLVTYASKSSIRIAMRDAGFEVEKLQGPKGWREMMRARKSN